MQILVHLREPFQLHAMSAGAKISLPSIRATGSFQPHARSA